MSEFNTDLVLQDLDGEHWKLATPLSYYSGTLSALVTVPAGTVTDLASIPQLIANLAPKTGRYDRAAVIHDWLYTTGLCAKEVADEVFHEAMLVCGVSPWRAWLMWKAVAWFGGHAWAAHRANYSDLLNQNAHS